jgi:hypothetical protein
LVSDNRGLGNTAFWNKIHVFESCRKVGYITVRENVKCTVVQALRLCTGRTAHRGSRGIGKVHRCTGTKAL